MNSKERHIARRVRRDKKRARNKLRRNSQATLENIASIDSLYKAALGASKGVRWKSQTQRYDAHILINSLIAKKKLLSNQDIRMGLTTFDIMERGKLRHIAAAKFPERVIQKSIATNALVSVLTPSLTQGCSANIKGRGTDQALIRLKRQLASHYQKYQDNGWILVMDFSDYFNSLSHIHINEMVSKALIDQRVIDLLRKQVESYGNDGAGLGLGSEPNQLIAVAFASPIDHLIERTSSILASGRYMDDSYAISLSKKDLQELLKEIESLCTQLGLTINKKKTKIIKLSKGFSFLKKRFFFNSTGKIIITPDKRALAKQRRKMRKHSYMVANGIMTYEQAYISYRSFRGSIEKKRGDGIPRLRMNTHRTAHEFDILFKELFERSNHD